MQIGKQLLHTLNMHMLKNKLVLLLPLQSLRLTLRKKFFKHYLMTLSKVTSVHR